MGTVDAVTAILLLELDDALELDVLLELEELLELRELLEIAEPLMLPPVDEPQPDSNAAKQVRRICRRCCLILFSIQIRPTPSNALVGSGPRAS